MATGKVITSTPLEYDRWGEGRRRLQMLDTEAPAFPSQAEGGRKEAYFDETHKVVRRGKNGRPLKNPRTELAAPGSDPHVVSFVDYHPRGENSSYIDYMQTRDANRGHGHARALVDSIYQQHDKVMREHGTPSSVDWGKVMDPAAGHLMQHFTEKYPNINTRGAKYY